MALITTRTATRADAVYVAARLRAQDRREIAALGQGRPREVILHSLSQALWSRAICMRGKAIAVYGLGSSATNLVGLPWLLGTDQLDQLGTAFVRESRAIVDEMLAASPALVNFVHANNEKSLRWLGWLGFHLVEPVTIAATGEPFVPFWAARPGGEAAVAAYLALVDRSPFRGDRPFVLTERGAIPLSGSAPSGAHHH